MCLFYIIVLFNSINLNYVFMRKKILIAGVFLLFCFFQTMAQQRTITGKVTSADGKPLEDATVLVAGQKTGVTTTSDGTFSINVPAKAKMLEISFVGYTTQRVDITSTSSVTVTLVNSGANLTDVVIVGYGTVRKKDLTGSIVSIKAKDFNMGTAIYSPDQLMQNKVAGLEVTSNTGQPGSATTVQIRGNNSLRSGNGPLYVIDGVPLDGRTANPSLDLGANGLPFGATPQLNPLLYINPNDIAQIDVLKDASSTAIYGSRGANGVIIITTKKGSSGAAKVEFGTSFGVAAGYMKKYKLLTASQFRSESIKNNLVQDSGSSVNMMKEITQNTISQNYNLAISAGNERGKFRASFLGSSAQGFVKKTSLDKYIANLGGQYKFLDDRLTLDFDLIAGHTTEQSQLLTNSAGAGGNLLA